MKKLSIVLAVTALALTGCGPSTFAAKGTITVVGSVTGGNDKCKGYQGYDDMDEGAQVKVAVDGKTVGTGSLKQGTSTDNGYSCNFAFEVPDVPAGSKFYSVTVSHRGSIDYKEDELKSGVSLQLGK